MKTASRLPPQSTKIVVLLATLFLFVVLGWKQTRLLQPESRTHSVAPQNIFSGPTQQCNVLVVGGTPSGIAAAIAAARRGAKVILIEEREHLGGDIVYAMLNMFDVPMRPNGTSPVAYGIFGEIFKETGIAFDIERAQHLLENKVAQEPNITVLRNTRIKSIRKKGSRVIGAVVESTRQPARQTQILATAFVDATNDADFAARAGAHYSLGRQEVNPDKRMQSVSLLFSVSGADWNAMKKYVRGTRPMSAANRIGQEYASDVAPTVSKTVEKIARQSPRQTVIHRLGGIDGNYIWERGDVVKAYRPHGSDVMVMSINFGLQGSGNVVLNTINMVNVNGLSLLSKKRARQQAIKELKYFIPYLRQAMPGMQNIQLATIAPELYVRETRHVHGFYTLQVADIKAQNQFPDAIAVVSYPIDLHPYQKGDYNPFGPKRYFYTLPLRSLIPRTIDGVFVASRSLSATYDAAGSARVIPITMAAGEASGVAAWFCSTKNITPHKIASSKTWWSRVQQELQSNGVKIDVSKIDS